MSKPKYAVATLLYTSDYLPGVFTLGYQLNKILRGRKGFATCLIISRDLYNNTLSELTKSLLRKLYDCIYEVDPLDGQDISARRNATNLEMLGRPELSFTLIKARLWELTQYEQVLYLDGDTLPLNEEFLKIFDLLPQQKSNQIGGAPDIGWPDMFNSGVLMLSPDKSLASRLQRFIADKASIDGADQGIFNQFFNPYCATSSGQTPSAYEWIRLPFIYNVTIPNNGYQSSPALKYFRSQVRLVHFIGENKPWKGWLSNDNNACFTQWSKLYRAFQQEYGLLQFFEELSIEPLGTPYDAAETTEEEDSAVVDWEKLNQRIMSSEPKRDEAQPERSTNTPPERVFPSATAEELNPQTNTDEKVTTVNPWEPMHSDGASNPSFRPSNRVERVFPATDEVFPQGESSAWDDTSDRALQPHSDEPTREIAISSEVPVVVPQPDPNPSDVERVFPEDSVEDLVRPDPVKNQQSYGSDDCASPPPATSKIGRVLEMIKEESEESSMPEPIFDWERTDYIQEVERTFPD